MDEAVNGLKAILEKSAEKTKGTKFDIYQDRKTKEYFIGKKGAVNVVRVVEGFKTLGEARTFLKEVTTEDLATKPLSKVFPKPDFKRLVEEGSLSEEGAILLNYLYDNIPTKPSGLS